jgi:AbrB family transcriptional regulator, transcriptional pleiotropic regulator of transition state genes
MKSLGMARKVDDLGRIVLPVELRRLLNINEGDHLEISVDASRIILEKLEERCIFCGANDGLRLYRAKQVCAECIAQLVPDAGAERQSPFEARSAITVS